MKNKHFLADRFPLIVAAVLMLAVSMLPSMALSLVIEPFYNESNGLMLQMIWCIGQIIVTILLMVLFEKWFVPEYEGSMQTKGLAYGLKLSLSVIIFYVIWTIIKILTKQVNYYPPDFEAVMKGMRPGISEEISFRGIAVALLLRRYRKPENIWVPVIFTSVFFGLTHLTNISEPDDLLPVAVTTVFAIVFGIIFGVIYVMCGSVWPTAILHSLYDINLICMEDTETALEKLILVDVAGMTLMMIGFLIFFLRNKTKAVELWNTKWHNELPDR